MHRCEAWVPYQRWTWWDYNLILHVSYKACHTNNIYVQPKLFSCSELFHGLLLPSKLGRQETLIFRLQGDFFIFIFFCSECMSVFRMPLLFLLRCCERYGSQVINNSDDSFNLTCLEILQLAKDKFLSTDKICFRKVIEMMEFGWLLVDLNCHIKYQPSSLKASPVLGHIC